MSGWLVIATAAGVVAVMASAIAIVTLAAVVRRWGAEAARHEASREFARRTLHDAADLPDRLRAIAHDLEVEARSVATASKEGAATPPGSRRNG